MEYQVLSRKYRPQNFNQIIGQPHIVDTLVNSINLNRIAHGYLLSGLRGVGKTTAARVFSKTLNCLNQKNNITCEECQNCIEITESRSLDVIELDGASNRGIDEIREIKETVKYPPVSSKYKIFIIDEVHMLTKEAFNALLKTLEEPPENIIFILATTNPFKIPDTILSRTLRFDFKKILKLDIFNHLVNILKTEDIEYEDLALQLISSKADGSMRDALSILDKIISYSHSMVSYDLVKDALGIIEDEVYLNLLNFIYTKNIDALLTEVKTIINSGYEINNFTSGFTVFLSNCLVYASGYNNAEALNDKTKDWLDKNKSNIINIDIMKIIDEIQKYEISSKNLVHSEIALESTLVKIAHMDTTVEISELLKNIKNTTFEKKNKIEKKIISESSNNNSVSKEEDKLDLIDKKILSPIDNWTNILNAINKKDARIYGLLKNVELKLNDDNLIIDLGNKGNDFIKNTLSSKKELIEDSIFSITNQKFQTDIVVTINEDNINEEKKHPLLDKIKNKFD